MRARAIAAVGAGLPAFDQDVAQGGAGAVKDGATDVDPVAGDVLGKGCPTWIIPAPHSQRVPGTSSGKGVLPGDMPVNI